MLQLCDQLDTREDGDPLVEQGPELSPQQP
jgi:hypothetical protein